MSAPSAGRRRRRLAAGGVGAAVLLMMCLGCGIRTEDTTRPTAAPCATPGVSAAEVKIGMVYPDSGPLATIFGTARSGFEARIDLENESGGVYGRKIEVVRADDGGQPKANGTVTRKLVEQDGVFAIAGLTTAASGSAQYLADAGIPVVGVAAERVWNDHDNMFAPAYIYSSGGSTVTTFGMFAKAQGGTKVAVVEDPLQESSRSLSDQIIASMHHEGVPLVARIPYTAGQDSPGRTVQNIANAGADVLVVQTPVHGLVELLAASRQAGVTYKAVLSAVAYDKDLLARVGPDLAGATAFFDHVPWESNSAHLTRFRETMVRYAPEVADPDQGIVLNSYVAADMLVRGLELAGECPTREAFVSELRALTDYDAAGLVPGGLDLSTNRGKLTQCLTFATVNPEGTAYRTVFDPNGNEQWCGERIES